MAHVSPVNLAGFGFAPVRWIGRGHFSSVQLVQDKSSGRRYVAKCVLLLGLSTRDKELANGEVDFLQELRHPRIVAYHDSFLLESANTLVILMEYCEGGDLRRAIDSKRDQGGLFAEETVMGWFAQIALALDFIHNSRVLHRDLKTSNIFLQGSLLKLGDFGIARVLECTSDNAETMVGTPYYMSPEVCKSEPYSWKSDVWSLGCVLYELCVLKHAFEAAAPLQLIYKIVSDEPEPIPDGSYSAEVLSLVQQLLAKSQESRPFIDEVLRQPFVEGYAARQDEPCCTQDTPRFWDAAEGLPPKRPQGLAGESIMSMLAMPEVGLVLLADRIRRRMASLKAPDGRPLTFATAFDTADGELSLAELRAACAALELGLSGLEVSDLADSLVPSPGSRVPLCHLWAKLLEAESSPEAKRITEWARQLVSPAVDRVAPALRALDPQQAGVVPVDSFCSVLKATVSLQQEELDALALLADKAESGDVLYELFMDSFGNPLPPPPPVQQSRAPPPPPNRPGAWPSMPTPPELPQGEQRDWAFVSCESSEAAVAQRASPC